MVFLFLPLRISLTMRFDEPAGFSWRIAPFPSRMQEESVKAAAKNKKKAKKAGMDNFERLKKTVYVLQTGGLLNSLWVLFKRLVRVVRISRIDTDLIIGLGDDYYTGMLCGLLLPALLILERINGSNIRLRPDFTGELVLGGYARTDLIARPAEIALPCLAFICSRPAWNAAVRLYKK